MENKSLDNNHMKAAPQKNDDMRNIEITTSKGGMEAFITISYTGLLISDASLEDVERPRLFTINEIKKALLVRNINYGIIQENLKKCTEDIEIKDYIIARGLESVNDMEDVIELKFKNDGDIQTLEEDELGKVDFRKIGNIPSVAKGEIIAVKVIGKLGHDGIDVYGNPKKAKRKRDVFLRAVDGCILKDDRFIEATIDGMPGVKGNSFYVNPLYTVNREINLETGNVKFIGDIKIRGNVKEGMKVEAGNSLLIEGNIENAVIWAKRDATIKGNVVTSSVTAGGKEASIARYMGALEEMKNLLNTMMETIEGIKKNKLFGDKISDGEIIKVLIENKFKNLPNHCWSIIRETYEYKKGENDILIDVIKSRLIGAATLQIKNYGELSVIVGIINKRMEELETMLNIPANLNISYCQNCKLISSGNINVTGSGQYLSELTAKNGIYFTQEASISRGGILQAGNEIKCKTVGSTGGVNTKIIVGKKGHIYMDIAYQNTQIVLGTREFLFDATAYNVHAYIDKNYELIVDKLKHKEK